MRVWSLLSMEKSGSGKIPSRGSYDSDTWYGRDLALKKREMLAVADKFTAEERAEFQQRLDECEVVEALASLPSAGETHNRSIIGESIELV